MGDVISKEMVRELDSCAYNSGADTAAGAECSEHIKEKFVANIDWDYDVFSSGGCHCKDAGNAVEPLKYEFYILKNGDVMLAHPALREEAYDENSSTYYLAHGGSLLTLGWGSTTHPTTGMPVITMGKNVVIIKSALDRGFYECYLSSSALNQHLTEPQKKAVDQFFTAVRGTVRAEYETVHGKVCE